MDIPPEQSYDASSKDDLSSQVDNHKFQSQVTETKKLAISTVKDQESVATANNSDNITAQLSRHGNSIDLKESQLLELENLNLIVDPIPTEEDFQQAIHSPEFGHPTNSVDAVAVNKIVDSFEHEPTEEDHVQTCELNVNFETLFTQQDYLNQIKDLIEIKPSEITAYSKQLVDEYSDRSGEDQQVQALEALESSKRVEIQQLC